MPFLYSPCVMCGEAAEWKQLIYYSIFVIIFQFGWAAVQIAHLALVPDLTNDHLERTDLLSLRFLLLFIIITYLTIKLNKLRK